MSTRAKIKYFFIFAFLNFVTYFLIQAFITTHKFDFMTSLDSAIPFIPEFIWIYHSLIPVIAGTMILLLQKKEIFFTALSAFMLATLILSFLYIAFPSFYPRPPLSDLASTSSWLVEITYGFDSANNTFPSSHVTFSWIIAFVAYTSIIAKQYRWLKAVYIIWALFISISTLLLKQHYLVDVVSGVALASLCYAIAKKFIFQRRLKTI